MRLLPLRVGPVRRMRHRSQYLHRITELFRHLHYVGVVEQRTDRRGCAASCLFLCEGIFKMTVASKFLGTFLSEHRCAVAHLQACDVRKDNQLHATGMVSKNIHTIRIV